MATQQGLVATRVSRRGDADVRLIVHDANEVLADRVGHEVLVRGNQPPRVAGPVGIHLNNVLRMQTAGA